MELNNLDIYLQLSQVTCLKASKHWRKCQPYLWNIFFKIDGGRVRLDEQFDLYGTVDCHFSPESHGNLAVSAVIDGQVLQIPEAVGVWQDELTPISVPIFEADFPGLIGVVTVLMEQGNVTGQGAEAGHQELNRYIEEAINDSIKRFDPKKLDILNVEKSVKTYLEHRIAKVADGVIGQVEGAIRKSQSLLENIWSLANKDSLIGYHIWNFTTVDILRNDLNIELKHSWKGRGIGEWEISGKLSARKTS